MSSLLHPSRMTIDEVLWRLSDAVNRNRLEGWPRDFARSIVQQSRRRGWRPTPKQDAAARRIVTSLRGGTGLAFSGETDRLIDDGDDR